MNDGVREGQECPARQDETTKRYRTADTRNENEAGLEPKKSRLPRQVRWYRQLMPEIGTFVSVEWTSHTKEPCGRDSGGRYEFVQTQRTALR